MKRLIGRPKTFVFLVFFVAAFAVIKAINLHAPGCTFIAGGRLQSADAVPRLRRDTSAEAQE
jgi:hypothetical protein